MLLCSVITISVISKTGNEFGGSNILPPECLFHWCLFRFPLLCCAGFCSFDFAYVARKLGGVCCQVVGFVNLILVSAANLSPELRENCGFHSGNRIPDSPLSSTTKRQKKKKKKAKLKFLSHFSIYTVPFFFIVNFKFRVSVFLLFDFKVEVS